MEGFNERQLAVILGASRIGAGSDPVDSAEVEPDADQVAPEADGSASEAATSEGASPEEHQPEVAEGEPEEDGPEDGEQAGDVDSSPAVDPMVSRLRQALLARDIASEFYAAGVAGEPADMAFLVNATLADVGDVEWGEDGVSHSFQSKRRVSSILAKLERCGFVRKGSRSKAASEKKSSLSLVTTLIGAEGAQPKAGAKPSKKSDVELAREGALAVRQRQRRA